MKKLFIFVVFSIMMGMSTVAMAQEATPTKVERQGDTFISHKKPSAKKEKSEPIQTGKFWKDTKGNRYPILMGPSGSCYVIKVSKKTGNEYPDYRMEGDGPSISAAICEEMGIEYKPKNK